MNLRTHARRLGLCLASLATAAHAQVGEGDILVTEGNFGHKAVVRVDPVTGAQSFITSGGYLGDPAALAVASDGRLFLVDGDRVGDYGGAPQVVRVDPKTGAQFVVSQHGWLWNPHDIAMGPDGLLYVADFSSPAAFGGIIRVDPSTGSQTILFISSDTRFAPFALAFEFDGTILYGNNNAFASRLYRLVGGALDLAALNVGYNEGIAIDRDGIIWIADGGPNPFIPGNVRRVDPLTGAARILTKGGSLAHPTDIGVLRDQDLIVVSADRVVRVDRATGAQSILSSGGILVDISSVTVVGSGR